MGATIYVYARSTLKSVGDMSMLTIGRRLMRKHQGSTITVWQRKEEEMV
jgi:hypothetical protein